MGMSKEVRIKIYSLRYEVEASLFSQEDDDLHTVSDDMKIEPVKIEINSIGRLTDDGSRVVISYDETEATGMDGSSTAISFVKSQPEIVTMTREGVVSTVLVFEERVRHHCLYKTPFMPFEVCVHTMKVKNLLQGMGVLELDYVIEIRGAQAERTKFRMELL